MSPERTDHVVLHASASAVTGSEAALRGYRYELWEPSLTRHVPPGVPPLVYGAWWMFAKTRVFRNGDYGAVLVWKGKELAHRLGIFPGWFRFPFMSGDDLQLGDLWTAPQHRGRGLATSALRFAVLSRSARGPRAFWYIAAEENEASIRAAERAGFVRYARAVRTRRWRTRLLGSFELHGAG